MSTGTAPPGTPIPKLDLALEWLLGDPATLTRLIEVSIEGIQRRAEAPRATAGRIADLLEDRPR